MRNKITKPFKFLALLMKLHLYYFELQLRKRLKKCFTKVLHAYALCFVSPILNLWYFLSGINLLKLMWCFMAIGSSKTSNHWSYAFNPPFSHAKNIYPELAKWIRSQVMESNILNLISTTNQSFTCLSPLLCIPYPESLKLFKWD